MSAKATEPVILTPKEIKRRDKYLRSFNAKIRKLDGENSCWEWTAGLSKDGYGKFYMHGSTIPAHRASYRLFVGEIPEGNSVLHACDNPKCSRPSHLFTGTHADNMADRNAKGRQSKGEKHAAIMRARGLKGDKNPARLHPEKLARGEAVRTSKLTNERVIDIRTSYADGTSTRKELALKYNVDISLIGLVVNRNIWKHIP